MCFISLSSERFIEFAEFSLSISQIFFLLFNALIFRRI
nr:MAG TPA: hypothetical protein [Bacteriophage sp.]